MQCSNIKCFWISQKHVSETCRSSRSSSAVNWNIRSAQHCAAFHNSHTELPI